MEQMNSNTSGTVAVIGLGYVGLPVCRLMLDAGWQVLGIDIDPDKIRQLKDGEPYLKHHGSEFFVTLQNSTRFEPTGDHRRLSDADVVVICVPTPLDDSGQPDLQYVESTCASIADALRERGRSQVIVLESTTYPGTTREIVKPILEQAGVPFQLAFSPERIDPGRMEPAIEDIPKVVGGIDDESTEAAAEVYRTAFRTVVPVSSCEVAEAAKLVENIYRAVNIALINEMKTVLDRVEIDIWEVINAAATKPYGYTPFYPGPGLGGHCIPIDPYYFAWRAVQVGAEARFVELAGEVNRSMPAYVVDRTMQAIDSRGGVSSDSPLRILILGLAYKPNVDDVRESPSFELIRLFRQVAAEVDYSDPHVPRTPSMRHYGDLKMASIDLTADRIAQYDAVVIATAHDAFDWELVVHHARLVVDTRNALAGFNSDSIIKA